MFILSTKLWESDRIIKIHCSNNWSNTDTYILTECFLKSLKTLLEEAQNNHSKAFLLCDCTKGELPPWSYAIQIAKFMVGIRSILEGGLEMTIIYSQSQTHMDLINKILSIYTPARPIHIVKTKKEIKSFLRPRVLAQ